MLTISVRSDFQRMQRIMTDLERRQLPFATARALTRTAQAARDDVKASLPTAFDRPTPFTRGGIGIKTATKAGLTAEVFVKDIQADYLAKQERGGVREPKKKALVKPVGIRINQYGNIANKAVAKAYQRKNTFSGTVRGTPGLWERTKKGGLKLLVRYEDRKQVKAKPWFIPVVTATVRRVWPRLMAESLRDAMRNARR
jgi:hypothetical protein